MFEREPSPSPTLVVHANRHQLDDTWINASRALWHYLKCEGQAGVSVEIADPMVYRRPQYSSVLPSDGIFPVWNQILDAIWTGINLDDVNAVGCYGIGHSSNKIENPTTVHIMVSGSSPRPWNPVRDQVVNILDQYGLSEVGVMIVVGERQRENDDSAPSLPQSACNLTAQVGMSMGISASQISSSTFGGFIKVYLPNQGGWTKLGLSCFHCVDPENKKDVRPSFGELLRI